ncbi:MAG: hypothetical protein WCQ80_01305 [Bacilli bacterium]
MEFFNEDEILKYFQKEIKDVSNRQIKKLQHELDIIKAKELEHIEKQVSEEINSTLGRDLDDLKIKHRQTLNDILTSARRDLIQYREDLLNSIMVEVTNRLSQYVKSPDYLVSMRNKLSSFPFKSPAVIHIAKKDHGLKVLIKELCINTYPIKEDETIQLGGFLVEMIDQGITIDETIDLQLSRKKQWFYENSHLFIEE